MLNCNTGYICGNLLHMIKYLLLPAALMAFLFTHAQKNNRETFYAFKQDWSPADDLDHATYFMQALKESDSCFVCRYYLKDGPMVMQESYADKDLKILNGKFAWYGKDGYIDSSGKVWQGKKDEWWYVYNDTGKLQLAMQYDKGKWLLTKDYQEKTTFFADGHTEDFPSKANPDSLQRKPAAFPGGDKAWRRYLEKALAGPGHMIDPERLRGTSGKVSVSFLVGKDGTVSDEMIIRSSDFVRDAEALRVIHGSGKWIPAEQNGQKVIYRQIQSVIFSIR